MRWHGMYLYAAPLRRGLVLARRRCPGAWALDASAWSGVASPPTVELDRALRPKWASLSAALVSRSPGWVAWIMDGSSSGH